MDRFVAWWRSGAYSCTGRCFDIGITTREALTRYERGGAPFAGSTSEDSAGNGSLMRLAPVALHALDDEAEARRIAREQSRTTHGAPQAVEACAFFVDLLREAFQGIGKDRVLAAPPWQGHQAIAAVAAGDWRRKGRGQISSSGYVVATLEAAIWCVARTQNFEAALILAVNLADDADTVGAVTGQLAGALYGASRIPEPWLERLAWHRRIEDVATALVESRRLRPADRPSRGPL
jgi:ADP-ribosyl-[dinitrogen reductase] hydrolase